MAYTLTGYNPWTKQTESFEADDAKQADSMKQHLVIRGLENIEIKEA